MGSKLHEDMKDDDVALVIRSDDDWLDMYDGDLGLVRHVLDSVSPTADGGRIVTRGADWSQMLIEVRGPVPEGLAAWVGKPLDIYVRRGEDGPWTDAHMIDKSMEIMPLRQRA